MTLSSGLAPVAAWAVLSAMLAMAPEAFARSGPQGPEQGALRRQLWLVPSQDTRVLMRTFVYRPPGDGPFPLVVINHGSVQGEQRRASLPQPEFAAASEWFVRRGYAVAVPQRPGHGETGGPYFETNSSEGGCDQVDYRQSADAIADSIQAAIDFLVRQSFVKRTGAIVVGHSSGGWGALALASRNPRDVKAIVSFAGGRGGRMNGRPNHNCAPEKLVEAARMFCAGARIPVLSIYARNDSFFGPDIAQSVNDAYRAAGGRIDFRLLPPFGFDGHGLLGAREGTAVWGPIVEEFLAATR